MRVAALILAIIAGCNQGRAAEPIGPPTDRPAEPGTSGAGAAPGEAARPLAASAQRLPSDAELERAHAVIGRVIVDNQNIFNLADPRDDNWLFRLADRLHPRTRAYIIREQLLFKPGDRYSRHALDESARILRAQPYFYDASIRPVRYHHGKVDVLVTTHDVWTLDPGFNFSRSGGTNTTGGQLVELNLVGTGTKVGVERTTDVDRTTTLYELENGHAFGTWTDVTLNYEDNSDGKVQLVSVNHPFYALETQQAWGITETSGTQYDHLWDLGDVVDEFQEHFRTITGYYGWSAGLVNGWVQRWSAGFTLDEHLFDPSPIWPSGALLPLDREFNYPWVEYDLVQDDFAVLHNYAQIARTEDFYLGTQVSARVGYAAQAFGSDRSAVIFSSSAGHGIGWSGGSILLLNASTSGRVENGSLRNAELQGSANLYLVETERAKFYAGLQGVAAHALDLDNQVLLGGDNGLRGYPLRFQAGTASALLTLEQRYFTDWYPFRLWRVGGAAFFDAGRTWGSVPYAPPSLGVLKDVGAGLRLGNARSGLGNITHVDLALPLDRISGVRGLQLLVQTSQSF